MDLLTGILSRRSVREYTQRPVPKDVLNMVLHAAMSAPSAGNQQPWEFIVIESQRLLERIEDIHPYAKMAKNAPLAIVVCGNLSLEKYPGNWMVDCAAACENILLAAHGQGFGGVWCAIYPYEDRIRGFRQQFKIPENIIPMAIIPIGYPKKRPTSGHEFKKDRIHRNFWDQAYFK